MRAAYEMVNRQYGSSFHAYMRDDPFFEFNWHYHPEIELTYIVQSDGTRIVGDHMANYTSGDLVLVGPHLPHTWTSDETSSTSVHRAVVVQFSDDLPGLKAASKPEFEAIHHLLAQSHFGLWWEPPLATAIGDRLQAMLALDPLPRLLALLAVLDELATADCGRRLASVDYLPQLKQRDESRMEKVFEHIHQHYRSAVSLAAVAEVAHLSPSAFSRYFRRVTGRTFVQYVTDLRIGRVCQELIQYEAPIATAAYNAGFNNLANFNRHFLARKQMSPREYVRRFREVQEKG